MPDSWNSYIGNRMIPNLDGLRGAAILLVLLHHCSETMGEKQDLLFYLPANGRMGVGLFFAISGFLICSLFYRELRKYGKIHLAAFFVRRTARLMPLYYGVLALEAFFVFGLNSYAPENCEIFVRKLPSYLLYFSNWVEDAKQGPFFVAWSLAVEEQFYLVFAFIFAFARKAIVPLLFILLSVKIVMMNLPGGNQYDFVMPWRVLLSYSEPILLGVGLAMLLEHGDTFRRVAPLLSNKWTLIGATTLILGILFFFRINQTSGWISQGVYLASTILIGGLATTGGYRILEHGLLPSVGRVCYGIYLLHMPIFNIVKRFSDNPALVFLVGGLATYLVALLVYRFFEAPFIRIGRKWSSKLISKSLANETTLTYPATKPS